MAETIFINGIQVYAPRQGAPDFVKGALVINPVEFAEFMRTNSQYINDKGQIRADIKCSKGGKWYIAVNTYGLPEPERDEVQPAPPREKTQAEISADQAYAEYGDTVPEF